MKKKLLERRTGITLIALIITIIVLLILAGVSISLVVGDNGVVNYATKSSEETRGARVEEEKDSWKTELFANQHTDKSTSKSLEELLTDLRENGLLSRDEEEFVLENGYIEIGSRTIEFIKIPFISECTDNTMFKNNSNTIARDELNNKIVIPTGFKVLIDDSTEYTDKSSPKVYEGIVIQDESGNEFVWIACGEIKTPSSVYNIELNRYTFDSSTGAATKVDDSIINELYQESDEITTATYNIEDFKESVKTYGGYYVGRYEAGYGGTIEYNGDTLRIPLSQKTNRVFQTSESVNLTVGSLWSNVPKNIAEIACSNLYVNSSIHSNLMNSYAWDTMLCFIQLTAGNEYSINNNIGNINTNYNILNTGETTDIACNIYDVADNLAEFTTESYLEEGSIKSVRRGGYCVNDSLVASSRSAATSGYCNGFRILLFL